MKMMLGNILKDEVELTISLIQSIKYRLQLFLKYQSLQCMIYVKCPKSSKIYQKQIFKPLSLTPLQLLVSDPRCRPEPEVQTVGSQASPCETTT